MSTMTEARIEQLLSKRAMIGRGQPANWPGGATQFEFGGGKPDPGSFPYDGIVEATAKMMAVEGAEALTYGEPMGYKGLRELIAHKYELFEGLKTTADDYLLTNGSSHAISLVISSTEAHSGPWSSSRSRFGIAARPASTCGCSR